MLGVLGSASTGLVVQCITEMVIDCIVKWGWTCGGWDDGALLRVRKYIRGDSGNYYRWDDWTHGNVGAWTVCVVFSCVWELVVVCWVLFECTGETGWGSGVG